MALSEKEKEKIIEEETLRLETRKKLVGHGSCEHGYGGHGCRRCRVCFWIILAVVVVSLFRGLFWHRGWCPYEGGHHGHGPGMMGWGGWDERGPQGPAEAAPQKAPEKK